ncbi:MAG: Hsp20/alpha crystallin family protein [Spirochaetia bacterium]|jgi:HSP20 family protein|nr:Hsp20/alpha crystallin family protein [Spirochaetia bacterium]
MRYLVNRPSNLFGDFDKVLNNMFENNQTLGESGRRRNPTVDIRESIEGYVLEVELPGLSDKDVDLKIEDNKLLISSIIEESEGKDSDKTEKPNFLLKERSSLVFSRNFILPKDANAEAVNASFSNGVLTINIEKSPEKQPRSIKIKAA